MMSGTGTSNNPPVYCNDIQDKFIIPSIILDDNAVILFRDTRSNWAKEYIHNLVSRSIINNTTYYRPEDRLTRAEFLKIVINTAGWSVPSMNTTLPYNDVSLNSWYAKYTSFALAKGMIQTSSRFRPNDTITRAEAMKILMIAL